MPFATLLDLAYAVVMYQSIESRIDVMLNHSAAIPGPDLRLDLLLRCNHPWMQISDDSSQTTLLRARLTGDLLQNLLLRLLHSV